MVLVRYKKPTEITFYQWIKSYPNSEQWEERIKKHPELKLSPLITDKFYRFVKTACKNRALSRLSWDKIEKIISQKIPNLDRSDLRELKEIFEHLVNFYKTPVLKGYDVETWNKAKEGYYIERGVVRGRFYEKEMPMDILKGGIAVYDEEIEKYKISRNEFMETL